MIDLNQMKELSDLLQGIEEKQKEALIMTYNKINNYATREYSGLNSPKEVIKLAHRDAYEIIEKVVMSYGSNDVSKK